jgi:magnesium transporter
VVDLPSNHTPVVRGDDAVGPPPAGCVRWVDLTSPTPVDLDRLKAAFGFDPLAIEDCSKYERHSKIDDYDKYFFVVIHGFARDPEDPLEIKIHEIHAFLGQSYLVTVHDHPLSAHDQVWTRAQTDPALLTRGPSWLLYLAAEAIVATAVPLVQHLDEELDQVERQMIEDGSDIDVSVVFRIKRSAVAMRRVLRPLKDTLSALHRHRDDRVAARTSLYFRDVADQVLRLAEMVEDARESATGLVSAYHALQAQRANEVMKRLTLFSAVFLPLGFVVGFWGQNFTGLPYGSTWALVFMLASLVAVPAGLMEWFRRNWL